MKAFTTTLGFAAVGSAAVLGAQVRPVRQAPPPIMLTFSQRPVMPPGPDPFPFPIIPPGRLVDRTAPASDGCCFSLYAHGGPGGQVDQLGDGQNRIGQTNGLPHGKYCLNDGGPHDRPPHSPDRH